jgi:hypothetical protein
MRVGIVAFIVFFVPFALQAESLVCSQLFHSLKPKPVVTEFRIEFNNSKALKILRQINRVFVEYPRGYMENTRTEARITVPESRWLEVFNVDYEAVIEELSKVEIYRVETFEDGTQTRTFDSHLLVHFRNDELKFFPNEWVTTQRSFSFQFDRRILTLMERHQEPAHVAIVLEHGTIERTPSLWDYY